MGMFAEVGGRGVHWREVVTDVTAVLGAEFHGVVDTLSSPVHPCCTCPSSMTTSTARPLPLSTLGVRCSSSSASKCTSVFVGDVCTVDALSLNSLRRAVMRSDIVACL